MIIFEKVAKKFGSIVALEEVSFTVEKGEFVFLTGPSGAGKTTVIKLLLGEYLASAGEIEISGEKLNRFPKNKLYLWRRKLGVVFQDYKLFSDRTVAENVALPLEIRKMAAGEIASRTRETLELVGLAERASLFPSQLSGGELQRTSLARAVITAPEVLLADEPTGNLDPRTSEEMIKLFREVNKAGTTVLMATHNQGIVDSFKTRVIELARGKVVRDEKEGKYQSKCQASNAQGQKEKDD